MKNPQFGQKFGLRFFVFSETSVTLQIQEDDRTTLPWYLKTSYLCTKQSRIGFLQLWNTLE